MSTLDFLTLTELSEQIGARIREITVPALDHVSEAFLVLCSTEAAAAHKETYPEYASEYGDPSLNRQRDSAQSCRGGEKELNQGSTFRKVKRVQRSATAVPESDTRGVSATLPAQQTTASSAPTDLNSASVAEVRVRRSKLFKRDKELAPRFGLDTPRMPNRTSPA